MSDENRASQRILDQAAAVLAAIDASFIVTQRDHDLRPLPTFRAEDIALGPVLGTGGFGIVYEVAQFHPEPPVSKPIEPMADATTRSPETVHRRQVSHTATTDEELFRGDLHVHYDVNKAKEWMHRSTDGRYAFKRLQRGLTPVERARGMLDLATEAKYLSIVWHPNICTSCQQCRP
jgi:hypothetical protein